MIPTLTPLAFARRLIGEREIPGTQDNPLVLWMLRSVMPWAEHDEDAWCSAFANKVCQLFDLPRSASPAARSWLTVGTEATLDDASADANGLYLVVLKTRDDGPGSDVRAAPGHVGFLVGTTFDDVRVLGGNQSNAVSEAYFPRRRVIAVRRLA